MILTIPHNTGQLSPLIRCTHQKRSGAYLTIFDDNQGIIFYYFFMKTYVVGAH